MYSRDGVDRLNKQLINLAHLPALLQQIVSIWKLRMRNRHHGATVFYAARDRYLSHRKAIMFKFVQKMAL
jgi:hypothetical protein